LGVVVIVPIVLGYMSFVHWVFRGKIGADAGYHQ
jgi:cytochrome d ubiquinol oxidase subunit II